MVIKIYNLRTCLKIILRIGDIHCLVHISLAFATDTCDMMLGLFNEGTKRF